MAAARRHRVWLRDEAERAATLSAVSAPRPDVSPLPAGAAAPATPADATPHTLEIRARGASPAPQPPARLRHEDAVIAAALAILDARLRVPAGLFTSPQAVKDFLRVHLAEREREAFAVLFLDNRHAAIGFDVLFEGTLTHTSVHPREIVRRAMSLNAAAVILSHNHPLC